MRRYPASTFQVRPPAPDFRPEPRGRTWLLAAAAALLVIGAEALDHLL